jgi:hypothetical protein
LKDQIERFMKVVKTSMQLCVYKGSTEVGLEYDWETLSELRLRLAGDGGEGEGSGGSEEGVDGGDALAGLNHLVVVVQGCGADCKKKGCACKKKKKKKAPKQTLVRFSMEGFPPMEVLRPSKQVHTPYVLCPMSYVLCPIKPSLCMPYVTPTY